MASLADLLAAFGDKAPTGFTELDFMKLRKGVAQLTLGEEPTLEQLRALAAIVRAQLPASQQGALDRIMTFAAGGQALAFVHFRRRIVALQLIQRLIWPELVEQKGTEFCGPTAFIINLCRNQAMSWSQLAVNLAESGRARLGQLQIAPGRGVRNRAPGDIANMTEADWILVASLRDTVSTDAAHLAGSYLFFKSFEEVGVAWDDLERWNIEAGFSCVVTLGALKRGDWISNFYSRPGASLPRLATVFKFAAGFAAPALRVKNMLQFASDACGNGWAVFFLVDDKLGRAMQTGKIADTLWLSDIQATRGVLGATSNPTLTQGQYTSMQTALTGEDVGGHVFLVLSLEIGGMYVSITALNRGELVTAELLPKDAFAASVRFVIAATDSA
jgi:hypothetical protein